MGVAVEAPYKPSRAATRNRCLDRSCTYRSCFRSVFKQFPFQKNSKTGTVKLTFFSFLLYMRSEGHHNQTLHFFHSYVVQDRVNLGRLSTHLPATCNRSPQHMALPSAENEAKLLNNIANTWKCEMQGDVERVLQCWRYLLPVFQNSWRTNYTIEALQYGLPPRLAEQLMWSQSVNTHGVQGKTIPLGFHQEHLNHICKTSIDLSGKYNR